ncbi:MAG: FKBP-type peptidyl-prolyl cis-trans isomerase [Candidatus Tectomicrobia bacterium]|nr:FKBP-type peptidyl-prolyl cis-trans isomerase [Candidatus Tectomicrobia bacterium]
MPIGRRPALFLCTLVSLLVAVSSRTHAADAKPHRTPGAERQETATVQAGKLVGIEYTVVLEDGSTVGSNVGKEPLVFRQGDRKILPALQANLEGLKVGDRKHITLPPEKAYGPIQPEAFQEVPAQEIPEGSRKVGTLLATQDSNGHQQEVRVHQIKADTIVLDLNHPLAGKTLTFDIRVVEVK